VSHDAQQAFGLPGTSKAADASASDRPVSEVATLRLEAGIAEIVVDAPPVNALGQAVRDALITMVRWCDAEPAIGAILLRCAGRTFFAGADIREFGKPPLAPSLPDVVNEIEACGKPVIAAIHGTALGGGLEVALACHYRVAVGTARMGFPEVKLGMLPGAGGTQRLPRLVPMEEALKLMTSGAQIGAAEAASIGLVDLVVYGDLRTAAFSAAQKMARSAEPPLRTSHRHDVLAKARTDPGMFDRFLEANAKRFRGLDAPAAIVAAARAAVDRPQEEGFALERSLFVSLRDGGQAAALRHVFFAEREAAKIPGLPADVQGRTIDAVGIVGAGTMGSGIAINFLLAGLPVVLVDTDEAALDRGLSHISRTMEQGVSQGRIDSVNGEKAVALLSSSLDFAALAEADLLIEAAYETMDVKYDIFSRLDAVARSGAVLATNTSYLDVDKIAAVTKRPQDVLGLHFFSPANVMKLLEIVRAEKTADDVLATAIAVAKRIGKVPVVAGVAYGFIGNRMLHVRRKAVENLLLAGVNLYRIDAVVEAFGMPMGPFRMYDLAGLDLGWSKVASTGATIQERLCERNRRGQKTNAGYYDYDDKRRPSPSQFVRDLIREFVAERGAPPMTLSDDQIRERLLFPMINEGYRILDEGKAFRASDIDTVWINGYAWPARTGGPMYYGEQLGLDHIISSLEGMGLADTIASGLRSAVRSAFRVT